MNRQDRLELKLQALPENTLTIKYLIPLFKRLGRYDKVEFYGGIDEGGKDIIFIGKDEIGDSVVDVVQVKRYKPTAKAGDSKSLLEIVRQLQQAVSKPVPTADGSSYIPRKIYLITPYSINTRTLQTAFEGYQSIRYRVAVIDGGKLASLMLEHLKDEVAQLLGPAFSSKSSFASGLNNQLLISALQYNQPLDLTEVYTDIDFILGRISTKLFFSTKFIARKVAAQFDGEQWTQLKRANLLSRSYLGMELLGTSPEDIEKKERRGLEKYEIALSAREGKVKLLSAKRDELAADFDRRRAELKRNNPKLDLLHKQSRESYRTLKTYDDARANIDYSRGAIEPKTRIELRKTIHQLNLQIKVHERPIEPFQQALDKAVFALDAKRDEISLFKKRNPQTETRIIDVDGSRLANVLRRESTWVRAKIREFKERRPSREGLRGFLKRCEELFEATDAILEIVPISASVGISPEQLARDKKSLTRLPLTVGDIFDTGLNFALLGEAGAGKTTTLVMAAKRRSERPAGDQLVFFVPLVSLILAWEKKAGRTALSIQSAVDLENALAAFFIERGATLTPEEMNRHFQKIGGTLVLDGIDEVIKVAPAIPLAIKGLSERYPRVQILVSSRMSGEYLKDIPFLGVTLLPFTPPQLRHFIKQSLVGDPVHADKAEKIVTHLKRNPALARVVRSPLLATILCVLAKKDVPLPDSEIRLYQERMRLLFGHYDRFKNIVRIQTPADLLDRVARKLAFFLHSNQSRYARRDDLYLVALKGLPRELSKTTAKIAVDELIDPCNVLQLMTSGGDYGFGL